MIEFRDFRYAFTCTRWGIHYSFLHKNEIIDTVHKLSFRIGLPIFHYIKKKQILAG